MLRWVLGKAKVRDPKLDSRSPSVKDGASKNRDTPGADEDLERENSEKTSSVHFLRFELTPILIKALQQGASLRMGVDHPAYHTTIEITDTAKRASLINDLSAS